MEYRGRQYSVAYESHGRHGIDIEAIWNDLDEDVIEHFSERTKKAIASEIWENDSSAQLESAEDFESEYHDRTGRIPTYDMMDLRQMIQ